jgi:hypothetical protein
MEKIINRLIIEGVEGCDVYHHNKSTWLIFTDTKQWVVELTNGGTLWYNYSFFNNLFQYVSLDVVDNQQYITKWMESFIKKGLNQTSDNPFEFKDVIENTIKYGSIDSVKVSEYSLGFAKRQKDCEDTIQNGVRKTLWICAEREKLVETTLNNGVKETNPVDVMKFFDNKMEEVLQNGIKNTQNNPYLNESWIEGVIKKGVKHTEDGDWLVGDVRLDDIIENGVKEIYDYKGHRWDVKDVIQDGVRDISPMTQYTDWQVEEIIENGVKETHDDAYHHKGRIDGVINNGVKEIYNYKGFRPRNIDDIIQTGVKETKTPGKDGDIMSTVEWMKENNSTSYPKMIEDVINNGVKETQPLPEQSGELRGYGDYYNLKEDRTKAFIDYLEETIKFGVKEVYWLPKEHKQIDSNVNPIDDVIENGVKEGTLI